MTHTNSRQLKL